MRMPDLLVGGMALAFSLPFAVLAIEAWAAGRYRKRPVPEGPVRLAVLIPAHNEAEEIEETIRSVRREIGVVDRIVVVADNCTDATAELAAAEGAEIVYRADHDRVGKGYALEAGVRYLALDPPEVVVFIDADCHPEAGAIRRIAARARFEARAIQGASLVRCPDHSFLTKVSALAFHLRNDVRPRGLAALDLPVLLQGTGMAVPWGQVARANLGGGHLAEDRKLGIDLAIHERSPRAEPDAIFWSALEAQGSVSSGQRSRWERGHLAALVEDAPRLMQAGVKQRRPELCALAAELSVPPLALAFAAWMGSSLLAAWMSPALPVMGALLIPGVVAAGLLLCASWRSPSTPISSRFLLAAPLYAIAKMPLYARAAFGQAQGWERARRSSSPPEQAATGSEASPKTFQIAGVDIHALTEAECTNRVLDSCQAGRGGWVVTPNVDFLERSNRDPGFRAILRAATLSVPDGMPLVWAARIAGDPVRGRVAGSDLISSLCAEAAKRDTSVFLLGGNEGSAAAAADILSERHPNLRVAGWHCPPFGFEKDDKELHEISSILEATKPDLVFVGLGSPKAERLIASLLLTHRANLTSTWWIGIGVSFSFICGEIERAPRILQRLGLEWVHRLVKEPRRLAGRYLVRDLPFALWLLASSIVKRTLRWSRA